MWPPHQDPEMIVKTLSSKIRKGFAEGVSRDHQQCVTVILKTGNNFPGFRRRIKHVRGVFPHNGQELCRVRGNLFYMSIRIRYRYIGLNGI